ncbi:glucokinase [Chelatococcus asaccharovorans]|uniref:glucokinase n=1 Tax=Chelatococcus asaccharovorans TaxID=28210 RepID=UPI00224C6E1E|nr:glucokinase [Chelatococcus asaccharovorans]CAH1656475.1 Glucokinase [Chelatococcus asaccharovorans]CAH1685099.1 Glucokinase [Chelatococcus asaccharovorans]
MTAQFPHPVLVGDVGGTNARFARVETPGAPLEASVQLHTHDHACARDGVVAAIAAMRGRPAAGVSAGGASAGLPAPRSMIVCGAGPLVEGRIQLTNAGWVLDQQALLDELGLEECLLLNDFEAQALSLPALPPEALHRITPDLAPGEGTRVILGPGTGLGVAGLIASGGQFTPVASEGGHVDFGPVTDEDYRLWPLIERVDGRVTAECLLSGPGLLRIYRAQCAVAGRDPRYSETPPLVEAAVGGSDPLARDTVRLFLAILARFAGDVALTFGARGGVYLSGGILPRIQSLIDPAAFGAIFADKAPVDGFMRRIAAVLVMEPKGVLLGMAALAAAPERYRLDWKGRLARR